MLRSQTIDRSVPSQEEVRQPTQENTGMVGCAIGSGPARAPMATGTMLGDWRIDAQVGEGGMGTVYSATHAIIGKQAALKVVRADLCASPETSARFVQEARAVNQIGHPNILDIFHIGQLPDGRPYLVMELLRGKTLRDRMVEGVALGEAIDILLQVCDALTAAHAHGVVHCDLKPDNIFLAETHSGTAVKLVDWGIARLTNGAARATTTEDSGAFGTPKYVSPEQARGDELAPTTDIYSLGTIAFELLTGRPPFKGVTAVELITSHLYEVPQRPLEVDPELPTALDGLLLGMLAKTPEYRPSLAEITAALLQLFQEHLEASAPIVLPEAAPTGSRRTLGIAAIGVVAVAAALLLWPSSGLTPASGASPSWPRAAAAAPAFDDWEAAVAALPGTLDIAVTPRDARITLDGVVVNAADGHLVQSVTPGRHELLIEARGFVPYRRSIDIHGTVLLDARLVAEPRAQTKRKRAAPAAAAAKHPDAWIDPFQ